MWTHGKGREPWFEAAGSGDRPVAVDPAGHLAHSSTKRTIVAKAQCHRSHISLSEFVAPPLELERKCILEIFSLDYHIIFGMEFSPMLFVRFLSCC